MKNWRDGIAGKEYGRFEGYGDTPPEKNGDYAWLMHILKALKSNGKAAVILPHGVLFRGNAEATIRKAIIEKHWIKGIISLPANLFYGTGIAACVLVIDKEGAANRQGIFMIDASRGYVKDGNKNRLRERDIYRIITTFNEQITTDPKYARFVPNDEIEKKNEYNLNITRYIDSTDPEDIQDIYAHIHGGIPAVDIDGLSKYWDVFPSLKSELLSAISEKYYSLNVTHENIRQTIYKNAEFSEYGERLDEAFTAWKVREYPALSSLDEDVSARELIESLAESILAEFEHLTLVDKYDVYQVLLAFRISLELGVFNNETLVSSLTDESAGVVCFYRKDKSAPIHFYKFAIAPYLHTDGGGGAMRYVDVRAYGALSFGKKRGHAFGTSLFHQGNHHGGGKHLCQAAAHAVGGHLVGDRLFQSIGNTGFYHNKAF